MRVVSAIVCALLLTGCGLRTKGAVHPIESAAQTHHRKPSDILVTTGSATDRPFRVIGSIEVSVEKESIFASKTPSSMHVDAELRQRAAELGADAVIETCYVYGGVGTLSGTGRAIVFTDDD